MNQRQDLKISVFFNNAHMTADALKKINILILLYHIF